MSTQVKLPSEQLSQQPGDREITFAQAINEALREEKAEPPPAKVSLADLSVQLSTSR